MPARSPSRRRRSPRRASRVATASAATSAGRRRNVRADSPVPAAACQAHAAATGDVSTAATAHSVVAGRRDEAVTPARPAARRRADRRRPRRRASGWRRAPWARAAVAPTRRIAGRRAGRASTVGREPPAGERHRPLAPVAPTGVDQPARHERRPAAVVDDGGDQPVVLVAEVGASAGPIAERPGGASAGTPGRPSASVTTSVHAHRSRAARAVADVSTTSAHTSTWASNTWLRRPPRPARSPPGGRARRAPAAASRDGEDRLRQHEPDAAAAGRASRTARARNSAAASAYGPPPCRLAPPRVVEAASCERYGGLPTTTSKRPAAPSRGSGRRRTLDARVSRPGERAPAAATAPASMSTADERRRPPAARARAGGGERGTGRRRTPGRAR